jgi:DNA-binding NarL/FixJ family response regulator
MIIIMVELSACFQMLLTDVAQASDLKVAGRRCVERLRDLAAYIESTLSIAENADNQNQSSDLLSSSMANNTHLPANTPHTHLHTHSRSEHTSSSALTMRENEILRLNEKGLPPRKIAARLQLSVKTVYTHLRNIRSKQRKLL